LQEKKTERPRVAFSFKIRPEIKEGVESLARTDRRSLSSYVELVLEDHLREKGYLPAGGANAAPDEPSPAKPSPAMPELEMPKLSKPVRKPKG
jgi:hypothetical protein